MEWKECWHSVEHNEEEKMAKIRYKAMAMVFIVKYQKVTVNQTCLVTLTFYYSPLFKWGITNNFLRV